MGQTSYTGTFYQIGFTYNRNFIKEVQKNEAFVHIWWLQQELVAHSRQVYSLLDLLGDLGGVTEVVMILFGFLLFAVSEHSFRLKASHQLYLARTKDN